VALKRINFLERRKGVFTYRLMFVSLGAWFRFLFILVGIQMYRTLMVDRRVALAKKQIVLLNTEKDKQMLRLKMIGRRRFGASVKEGLASILKNRPLWSKSLKSLTDAIIGGVWLDSVDVRMDKDGYTMEISGRAASHDAINSFIVNLESNGKFEDVVLVNSNREGQFSSSILYRITAKPVVTGF